MIHVYYDSLMVPGGGIGTYFHALSLHLHAQNVPFRSWVVEITPSPLAEELEQRGVSIYRQRRLPGDRWLVRKRIMQRMLGRQLRPGDWVFAVCPPDPALYQRLVKIVHRRGAKLAVSWYLAPEFWPLDLPGLRRYSPQLGEAIRATDLLVSVSKCTVHQFKEQYDYDGPIAVVPYHNLPIFQGVIPLPPGPPWKIGFIGRLEAQQKNLDGVLRAFAAVRAGRTDIELHLHGGGPSREELESLARELGIERSVHFHGQYDHRRDLPAIVASCHLFLYPSRSEGGPCFSVLELMQAGRLCVVSDVGGLPDLFRGHPELGILVPREDHAALVRAMGEALMRVAQGRIDGEKIRGRYYEHWDMDAAHRAFRNALGGMGVPPM
jgi:glycosyltransferase involved in cell wall biosynthesis